jgi:hypothetical protein
MQMQPPVMQSWEELAIPFFFANHTIPAASGRPGHLDFIPDLYGKPGSHGRCFDEALLAVSAGHFARYRHDAALEMEAMLAYGKALSSLRLALSDDKSAQQNGTVVAMLLLSRLEVSLNFVEPFKPKRTDTSARRSVVKNPPKQASISARVSR